MPQVVRIKLNGEWVEVAAFKPDLGQRVPLCLGRLDSPPVATGVGDTYYDTVASQFFAWSGTSWVAIS